MGLSEITKVPPVRKLVHEVPMFFENYKVSLDIFLLHEQGFDGEGSGVNYCDGKLSCSQTVVFL